MFKILNNLTEDKAGFVDDLCDYYGVSQMAFGFTLLYYYVINTRRNTADSVAKKGRCVNVFLLTFRKIGVL